MGLFFRPRSALLRPAAGAATVGVADQPTQAPPAPTPTGTIAELERLSRLHESGALTDQEYAADKARALGI